MPAENFEPAQCGKSPPGRRNGKAESPSARRSPSCVQTPVVTSHFSPSADAGVLGVASRLIVAENSHPERVEVSDTFEAARVLRGRILVRLQEEEEDQLAAKLE